MTHICHRISPRTRQFVTNRSEKRPRRHCRGPEEGDPEGEFFSGPTRDISVRIDLAPHSSIAYVKFPCVNRVGETYGKLGTMCVSTLDKRGAFTRGGRGRDAGFVPTTATARRLQAWGPDFRWE